MLGINQVNIINVFLDLFRQSFPGAGRNSPKEDRLLTGQGYMFIDWGKLHWATVFFGAFSSKSILARILEANKSYLFERLIT